MSERDVFFLRTHTRAKQRLHRNIRHSPEPYCDTPFAAHDMLKESIVVVVALLFFTLIQPERLISGGSWAQVKSSRPPLTGFTCDWPCRGGTSCAAVPAAGLISRRRSCLTLLG